MRYLSIAVVTLVPCLCVAAPDAAVSAPSSVTAVTVYQSSALVARDVTVPQGTGTVELVIPSLPASTIQSSLYAESNPDIRVLSTRYRTRPLQQTSQEELRKLEAQVKELGKQQQVTRKQIETDQSNLQLLLKLENFTQATMAQMTEKGALNPDAVTKLAAYIMDTRAARNSEVVNLEQQMQAGSEQQAYLQREIARLSGASDKTSREAVIVVDKANNAAGKVTLYYLVSAASWKPQYKIRATTGKPQVEVEYLAAISQQTGEDWTGVDMTLSTATPMFNAAPPELAVMDVQPGALMRMPTGANSSVPPQQSVFDGINVDNQFRLQSSKSNGLQQMKSLKEAEQFAFMGLKDSSDKAYNLAAAVTQADELVRDRDELRQEHRLSANLREGQSVTFHLARRMTIPWRDDEQWVEVSRLSLPAEFLYKAVPVLTPHVYRLADLTNNSKQVILPGEAAMYVGTDFVGRASLPLVAIGQSFTAGFGVDPQIQVQRQLVDKTRTIQGGNQVQKFDYRLSVNNYKSESVKLELWDRIPHAQGDAITITLASTTPAISTDEAYVRDQKTKNLLRWDMVLEPNTSAAKATQVNYQYKMEYAKDATIGNIFNR